MPIMPYKVAGQYQGGCVRRKPKQVGTAFTRGQLCIYDTANNRIIPCPAVALQLGPFVMCETDALAADTTVAVVGRAELWYLTTDNGLNVGDDVQNSDSTAGRIKKFVATVIGAAYVQAEQVAEQNDDRRRVGLYEGHPGEVGAGDSTAAIATEVVAISPNAANTPNW